MRPASEITGRGADTRRFVVGLSGAVARSNTTPTKNTRRPSQSRRWRARRCYARVLYHDTGATLDDLREAVTTLEEIEPIARRVFGGAYPITVEIEGGLRESRAVLRFREASGGKTTN